MGRSPHAPAIFLLTDRFFRYHSYFSLTISCLRWLGEKLGGDQVLGRRNFNVEGKEFPFPLRNQVLGRRNFNVDFFSFLFLFFSFLFFFTFIRIGCARFYFSQKHWNFRHPHRGRGWLCKVLLFPKTLKLSPPASCLRRAWWLMVVTLVTAVFFFLIPCSLY